MLTDYKHKLNSKHVAQIQEYNIKPTINTIYGSFRTPLSEVLNTFNAPYSTSNVTFNNVITGKHFLPFCAVEEAWFRKTVVINTAHWWLTLSAWLIETYHVTGSDILGFWRCDIIFACQINQFLCMGKFHPVKALSFHTRLYMYYYTQA